MDIHIGGNLNNGLHTTLASNEYNKIYIAKGTYRDRHRLSLELLIVFKLRRDAPKDVLTPMRGEDYGNNVYSTFHVHASHVDGNLSKVDGNLSKDDINSSALDVALKMKSIFSAQRGYYASEQNKRLDNLIEYLEACYDRDYLEYLKARRLKTLEQLATLERQLISSEGAIGALQVKLGRPQTEFSDNNPYFMVNFDDYITE